MIIKETTKPVERTFDITGLKLADVKLLTKALEYYGESHTTLGIFLAFLKDNKL